MEKYLYNRDMILKNIDLLMRERDVKSSEIEEKAGVSKGYISRIKDSDSSLFVTFIMGACNALDCTIDELVRAPLDDMSENEKLILKLIQSLTQRTQKQEIPWQWDDPVEEMKSSTFVPEAFSDHPLYQANLDMNGDWKTDGDPFFYTPIIDIPGEESITKGKIYRTNLRMEYGSPKVRAYLACVATKEHPDKIDFELFSVTLNSSGYASEPPCPLCSTRRCKPALKSAMLALKDAVNDSMNKIFLDKNVKSVLADFIASGVIDTSKQKRTPPKETGKKYGVMKNSGPVDEDIPF